MSKPNPTEPVKLIFSVFAKETELLKETIEILFLLMDSRIS